MRGRPADGPRTELMANGGEGAAEDEARSERARYGGPRVLRLQPARALAMCPSCTCVFGTCVTGTSPQTCLSVVGPGDCASGDTVLDYCFATRGIV